MWRACVCVDREDAAVAAGRRSFRTWKPAADAQQRRRHLPRLQRPHDVDEHVGQAVGLAQADLAAAGAVAVFRHLARHLVERLAGADARQRRLGPRAALGDDGLAGAFGHRHQHLRDVVGGGGAGRRALLVEQGVDLVGR